MSNNYVYILLRKDLSNSQRVVQSSHVAWEISKKHSLNEHPSVIVIGIKDEPKLIKEWNRIKSKEMDVTTFYEPLFENKLSCIAVLTKTESEREFFKRYNLLSNESFYSITDQEKIKLKNCSHKKTKASYRESLAYEFYPVLVCKKCGEEQKSKPTDLEKINLVKEFYDSIDIRLTDEEVNLKKEGFNI